METAVVVKELKASHVKHSENNNSFGNRFIIVEYFRPTFRDNNCLLLYHITRRNGSTRQFQQSNEI